MRITADTDRERLQAHVGSDTHRERLRNSEARRKRLQRNARIRSGVWDLEVRIEPEGPPAALVRTEEGHPELVVTGAEIEQRRTDYPPREWDLLAQKALSIHEVGHLNYTDHDDFRRRLEDVPAAERGVAAAIWNAFEDGAVEAQIRHRWPNFGTMVTQLRANCYPDDGPAIPDPGRGGYVFPIAHAVVQGILDATTYDSGTYRRLLDPDDDASHFATPDDRALFESEIRDPLEETVRAVMAEPDAVKRNRLVFAFLAELSPLLAEATADGKAQLAARRGTAWGLPDDAHLGESGGAEDDADALAETEFETVEGGASLGIGGEGETGQDDTERNDSDGPEETEAQPQPAEREPDDSAEADPTLRQALSEEIRDQASASREDTDEQVLELDRMQEAVEAIDAELETDGIVVPEDDAEADEETYRAALEDAGRLARLLRNRFQKQRKRDLDRNRRRGRLDPSALHRVGTDGKRLKMQRNDPDETDHHCLFVIDRSGSMNGETIRTAERAMGMLVLALEEVDVDVAVLELYDKQCRLVKPFDQPARTVRDRLFNGNARGGTPLADTLHVARERLNREQGKRFLFVVTDGTPSEPDRYMDALDRCTMPVVGVNLNEDTPAGRETFHRQVTVDPETVELRAALRGLVQEVLFE